MILHLPYLIPTQKAVEVDNRVSEDERNEAYINKLMEIPEENYDRI